MNRLPFIIGILLGLCLMGQWSWATNAYVTDSLAVNVHEGPSTDSKVIAFLSSGASVQVFHSHGDWSFVRLLEGRESNKEGFILSRFLITRLPWKIQARPLKEENSWLKERLSRTERKLNEAIRREQAIASKVQKDAEALHELQTQYESFRREASDYLSLQAEYKVTLSSLETTQKDLQRLSDENERLISSQRNKLFAAEGLVLLCGLMIGLVIGRELKKRRLSYY